MWTRYELKQKAKKVLKRNYWAVIAVCFILAFSGAEYSSSASYIHKYSQRVEDMQTNQVEVVKPENHVDNWEILKRLIQGEDKRPLISPEVDERLSVIFNKLTSHISFVFNAFRVDSGKDGVSPVLEALLVILAVGAELSFTIFVANVLIVGGKRFFLETRVNPRTRISRMTFIFRKGRYRNAVRVMFFRSLYTGLWFLTIIGGVIKYYEYLMIPYIVAENPEIDSKEAFKLSKEMMRGQKWQAFVLELSFIGWELLSAFTLGLVSIFFTNGYRGAAVAELYQVLRKEAIDAQKPGYERLCDPLVGHKAFYDGE